MVSRTTLPTMRALLIPSWLMLKQWMHSWIDLMLVLIDEARCVNCSAFHYLFFMGQCHTRVWLWILCKCSAILISPEDTSTSSASADEPVVQPVEPVQPEGTVVPQKKMPQSKAPKAPPWVPLPPGPPPEKNRSHWQWRQWQCWPSAQSRVAAAAPRDSVRTASKAATTVEENNQDVTLRRG